MKYYRLQGLFLISLLAIYLVANYSSWWLLRREEGQRQFSRFAAIIEDSRELQRDLIEDSLEEFPNYEKKLMLVEMLHYSWIQKISSILKSPKSSWKKQIKSIPLPFPTASGFFLARGSRVLMKNGVDFKELLGKNWVKRTFLAIQGGEKTFLKMQQLYLVPLSFEQFQGTQNSFQTIFYYGRYLYRYYREVGPFRFLIIVDLGAVSIRHLKERIQDFLLQSHENLRPSSQNEFEFDGSSRTLPSEPPGFKWVGTFPSYLTYLSSNTLWNLAFLVLVVWLYRLGGYRILFLRFESKLFLIFMIFMGFLYLGILFAEQELLRAQTLLDQKTAEAEWRSFSKELESKYEIFLKKLGDKVREAFQRENPLSQKDLWSNGLYGVYYYPPFQVATSETAFDVFTNIYLFRLSTAVLSTYKGFGPLMEKDPRTREMRSRNEEPGLVIADFIKRAYGISKIEDQIPGWVQYANRKDQSFRKNILAEGQNVLKDGGKWTRYRVLMMDQYFLGLLEDVPGGPRSLGATINAQDLFVRYLQEVGFEKESLPPGAVLLVEMPGRRFFSFPEASVWNAEFFHTVWNQTRQNSDRVVSVRVEGDDYLGSFFPSEVVPNFRYLILQKSVNVLSKSADLKRRFEGFHIGFWVLGVLVFFWLGRSVIRPLEVLRSGFQRLRQKELGFQLSISGKHEGAEMIQRFNEMVLELDQKERMLPYVSSAVLDLLDETEGKASHSGQAVVLVSDIRSFTSLSELYTPEEIVEMLGEYFSFWQERVEKYGGVIERFVGDAVVALFFEKSDKHFIQGALQCSLEVHQLLSSWNQHREESGLFTIRNGVGLALGEVSFGLVGTRERMEFLSLGDPLRKAEYLETLTAHGLQSDIFVDPSIESHLRGLYDFDAVEIPGEEQRCFEARVS